MSSDNAHLYNSTFVFENEDHTMGNAIRYVLAKNEDVDFVGYAVPHPAEPKMNIRLQTKNRYTTDVIKQGVSDLKAMFQHLKDTTDNIDVNAFCEVSL